MTPSAGASCGISGSGGRPAANNSAAAFGSFSQPLRTGGWRQPSLALRPGRQIEQAAAGKRPANLQRIPCSSPYSLHCGSWRMKAGLNFTWFGGFSNSCNPHTLQHLHMLPSGGGRRQRQRHERNGSPAVGPTTPSPTVIQLSSPLRSSTLCLVQPSVGYTFAGLISVPHGHTDGGSQRCTGFSHSLHLSAHA